MVSDSLLTVPLSTITTTGVLDATKQYPTEYCIPLWLRDEQIKLAIQRIKARIEPHERRDDPIAIVGFGPSLNDTWEKIRDFKYIMSCSGSHKYLVDRGIIPTWHVEVDPRIHKIQLIGQPQKETQYLIASTCHPKLFDHLDGYDVSLWHIFDASDDGLRLLPQGEWLVTGGCDVGLRALTLAAFLGFRDLHIFGMDGNARERKHADEHPNAPKKFSITEYDGMQYLTTSGMLTAAQQIWHELDMMPKVNATFYGEGLIQAMSKKYVRKSADNGGFSNIIGYMKPELISSEYKELNVRLHQDNLAYGVGGGKHATTVIDLVRVLAKEQDEPVSVLDYGCGKGYLQKALPFAIFEYDPAILGKDESPRPADLVCCFDTLEHIEPNKIIPVLNDLRRCVKKLGYFIIHTGPSTKTLADGRNAHLLQRDLAWWKNMLKTFFIVGKIIEAKPLLHVIVVPLKKPKKVVLETTSV